MRTIVMLYAGLLCLLPSCKNHKDPFTVADTPADYFFPLKTGNYWIYKSSMEGPNGNTITYDTVKVTGDTLIEGNTWHVVQGNVYVNIPTAYYRSHNGGIQYVTPGRPISNFALTITPADTVQNELTQDGYLHMVQFGGATDTTITVPAGTYSCAEKVAHCYYVQFTPPQGVNNPRYFGSFYTKGIGQVKNITWYVSAPYNRYVELAEYFIAP